MNVYLHVTVLSEDPLQQHVVSQGVLIAYIVTEKKIKY
jgi:hypothetical protein